MACNSWKKELNNWLNTIQCETANSLKLIKKDLISSGIEMRTEFKENFLKSGYYRLMETYEQFEMEESLTNPAIEPVQSSMVELSPREATNNDGNDVSTAATQSMLPDVITLDDSSIESPLNMQVSSNNSTTAETSEIRRLNNTEWMCFICTETKQQNLQLFVFRSMEDLHTHWQLEHSGDGPLKFHVVDLLSCNIGKCRYFSTFKGLQNHHKKRHPNELFVAAHVQRCSLCFYSGDDLSQHSCDQLQKVQAMKLFNPILFTDERMAELQSINRKFHCKHCNNIFNAKEDVLKHHYNEHRQEAISIEVARKIDGLICGCCRKEIAPNSHVKHLEAVAQKRWSIGITWEKWFTRFMVDYLKTKVIFVNGLVVFKQNLIATDLGGDPAYKQLARRIYGSLTKQST